MLKEIFLTADTCSKVLQNVFDLQTEYIATKNVDIMFVLLILVNNKRKNTTLNILQDLYIYSVIIYDVFLYQRGMNEIVHLFYPGDVHNLTMVLWSKHNYTIYMYCNVQSEQSAKYMYAFRTSPKWWFCRIRSLMEPALKNSSYI